MLAEERAAINRENVDKIFVWREMVSMGLQRDIFSLL